MEKILSYKEETTYEGVELTIEGEVYDEPIYRGQDFCSHVLIKYTPTDRIIGALNYIGKLSEEDLHKAVKYVASNPDVARIKDRVAEIIKQSKDYKDEPSKNN